MKILKIPKKNRAGFTFIESLIVVMIVGVLSVVIFNSYQVVSARVAFQNQMSQIQFWSNGLRSLTVVYDNDEDTEEQVYTLGFLMNSKKINQILDGDSNLFNSDGAGDQVLADYDLDSTINPQNKILISGIFFYDNDSKSWLPAKNTDLVLTFNSKTGACGFEGRNTAGSDPMDPYNVSMVKVPIRNVDLGATSTPVRYIYFHKKSCNLEILNTDIL